MHFFLLQDNKASLLTTIGLFFAIKNMIYRPGHCPFKEFETCIFVWLQVISINTPLNFIIWKFRGKTDGGWGEGSNVKYFSKKFGA